MSSGPTGDALGLEADAIVDALLGQASICVTIVDRDLRIVRTNGALGIFDRPAEALVGVPIGEAVPQLASQILPALQAVLESGEPSVSYELTVPDASAPGTTRSFRGFRTPIVAAGGEIIGVTSTAVEVTDLEQARGERDDALARYRAMFDGASIGVLRVDRAGRVVEANPAVEHMLGYGADELKAMRFQEYTHADDVDENLRHFHEIMDGEQESYAFEKRCFRKSGEMFWVRVTAAVEHGPDGARTHAITMLEDITERKLIEAARLERATLSEYQAGHDALTGLANRRQLAFDLAAIAEAASREHPARLVVFDLDGFKAYNDAFGHHGGDLLLCRLAATLTSAVGPHGTSYRLGGDEFCALFAEDVGDVLVRRCVDALGEVGDGFSITSSHGSVLLPTDARDPALALQLADERMYSEKSSSRSSAGQQTRNLALKMLSAQQPDVEHHSAQVAALVDGVGRRLGLPAAERVELVRAAELHDIGKIAIPYAILHKPGPLDEREWALMRSHPSIGANILSSAPALGRVAAIVRSTHERFDGGGYPLGIAGNEIPLASRIVSVCDSFHAMVSARPHSPSLGDEGALEELRRHAGTQFDPAVVAAFCAEYGSATAAGARLGADLLQV